MQDVDVLLTYVMVMKNVMFLLVLIVDNLNDFPLNYTPPCPLAWGKMG